MRSRWLHFDFDPSRVLRAALANPRRKIAFLSHKSHVMQISSCVFNITLLFQSKTVVSFLVDSPELDTPEILRISRGVFPDSSRTSNHSDMQ